MLVGLDNKIFEHLLEESPKECCGLVVEIDGIFEYVRCKNIAEVDEHFIIDPEEFAYYEDQYNIFAIVHSHIGYPAKPSPADFTGIQKSLLPWIIMNDNKETSITYPLIGREFSYGVLDCYTLAVDYYRQFNIDVEDFERPQRNWWKTYGENYKELYTRAGFVEVSIDEAREHDLLVMSRYTKGDPDHYAIYLGNNKIIHHAHNRISCIEELTGDYIKSIVLVLRRKEFT